MYYPDLTPYEYFPNSDNYTLNIGWLDNKHEFPKGEPDQFFLDSLAFLCRLSINRTRGFHDCEFCDEDVQIKYQQMAQGVIYSNIGSCEIRVDGRGGIKYAAPVLIYHYISVHKYRPPAEFIEAVCQLNFNYFLRAYIFLRWLCKEIYDGF